mmetsp:Transcript_26417/g.71405  ORF Transcript_26417/g.71405 Transcript_26417/m.71405 type:complete len:220 (-) Transcript_26417:320-979(-)
MALLSLLLPLMPPFLLLLLLCGLVSLRVPLFLSPLHACLLLLLLLLLLPVCFSVLLLRICHGSHRVGRHKCVQHLPIHWVPQTYCSISTTCDKQRPWLLRALHVRASGHIRVVAQTISLDLVRSLKRGCWQHAHTHPAILVCGHHKPVVRGDSDGRDDGAQVAQQQLGLLRWGLLLCRVPARSHSHISKLVCKQGVLAIARERHSAQLLVHAPCCKALP